MDMKVALRERLPKIFSIPTYNCHLNDIRLRQQNVPHVLFSVSKIVTPSWEKGEHGTDSSVPHLSKHGVLLLLQSRGNFRSGMFEGEYVNS